MGSLVTYIAATASPRGLESAWEAAGAIKRISSAPPIVPPSDPGWGLPWATSRSSGYPYGHIASLCLSEIRAIMPPVGV